MKHKIDFLYFSAAQAQKYFSNDIQRACKATEYAKQKGSFTDYQNNCRWWLRTPGKYQGHVAYVLPGGIYLAKVGMQEI